MWFSRKALSRALVSGPGPKGSLVSDIPQERPVNELVKSRVEHPVEVCPVSLMPDDPKGGDGSLIVARSVQQRITPLYSFEGGVHRRLSMATDRVPVL